MRRLLLFVVLTWFATDLGYASFRPELTISLVWPVTGVLVIWAGTGSRRTWPVDAVAALLTVCGSLLASGASWQIALMAGVQSLVQIAVHVAVTSRLAPDLWGAGGTRPMTRLADLSTFLFATAIGSTAGAVVRAAGLGLIPTASLLDASLVWVRNFGWAFVIGAVALQLVPVVTGSRQGAEWHRRVQEWWGSWPPRTAETTLLFVVSGLVYLVVLSEDSALPVTYVLVLPALWASLRLSPPVASIHALLCGVAAILSTLASFGVFASVSNPVAGATMAQAFMVSVMLTSLVVSLVTAERAVASAEAAQRAGLLSAVLEQIREGIIVIRGDGVVLLRNTALTALAGTDTTTTGEQLPEPPVHDSRGRLLSREELPYARALRGEEVVAEEIQYRPPDAEPKVLEVSASLLPTVDDDLPEALMVVRDVTLVRQREDALAAFAGVVAHDLSNPLTVVHGWADALADCFAAGEVDSVTGTEMTGRIQEASEHMRAFLDDLLSYTVARDQPLRLEDLDLSDLVEQVARMRRGGPTEPRIVVQPGMRARGDQVLVRQLLDNLVGNAVKYVADDVRPQVDVSAIPRGEMIEVRVTDNGVGVPRTQRERIFETFVRAHGSDYGGTGIGLGICRRVVLRHGGRIHVEDAPGGRGSRFVFTLPRVD